MSGSSPEFVSLFGEDQAAQFWGVVALDDGGALAVGSTAWGEASSYDVSIVVADLDGKLVAEHRWGEEGNETARAVARAAAGGFAVVGSATDGQGAGDGILLGLSPTGEVLWQQRYEGGGSDSFSAVAALGDGGYALAGIAKAAGATSQAWVVRTDAAGKALWQALLAGQKSEAVTAVIEAAGGGVVVAGHRRDISIERYDAWLEWLDGSGASLGRRVYVEQSLLSVSGLVATQDGGAALLLDVYEGGAKAVVIRVNAAGDELWRATVPLPGGADAPSVVLAEPGGTYRVVSTIFGSPSPGRVLVFSRLGAEGQLLGQVEVNPHERVGYRANAAARLASGAFLLAGGSWVAQSSAASSAARAALLRLDPDGAAGCEPRLGCLGKPFAACDDGDPCTIETCDGAKGCLHGPDATKACSPAGG